MSHKGDHQYLLLLSPISSPKWKIRLDYLTCVGAAVAREAFASVVAVAAAAAASSLVLVVLVLAVSFDCLLLLAVVSSCSSAWTASSSLPRQILY